MPEQQVARLPSSFRDADGFVFQRDGEVYRQINQCFAEEFTALEDSGIFEDLFDAGLLVRHERVDMEPSAGGYCIIKPDQVPFISYPYEWSFGQLKDAALLTLEIQRRALAKNLSLKDASAYNVQFIHNRSVFIDTLSFEPYEEGKTWVAYRQFCQHFLAPLALGALCDIRLLKLARQFIDGIPLDLAANLLPKRSKLRFGLLVHLHWHAKSQVRFTNKNKSVGKRKISRNGLLGILDNLKSTVEKLQWLPANTEWGDYYAITNYSETAFNAKKEFVLRAIETAGAKSVWDLGANNGKFSRLASSQGIPTVAWDIDPAAVELNYRDLRKSQEKNLYPALVDLSNPSPGIGWNNDERDSIFERHGKPDLVLCLALIHHLAIGNNVPLPMVAEMLARVAPYAVVEFVPKGDSKVDELLLNREDIFEDYTVEGFERTFGAHFETVLKEAIVDSSRVIYLLKRHI